MDTGITITVVLAMIALGVFLIHLLNGQHDERIALHSYSRRLPGRRRAHSPVPSQPGISTHPPAVRDRRDRRDHRDGGRGRLPARRKTPKSMKYQRS
ncbi:hypothetical protein ACFQVC_17000 [Streptomyces monticola]|uniref:Uncharacterized protein n=1 Tax=Streptomyces monticola TaxID=2666263 RepID=A0ABW2JKG4_9ACTN